MHAWDRRGYREDSAWSATTFVVCFVASFVEIDKAYDKARDKDFPGDGPFANCCHVERGRLRCAYGSTFFFARDNVFCPGAGGGGAGRRFGGVVYRVAHQPGPARAGGAAGVYRRKRVDAQPSVAADRFVF